MPGLVKRTTRTTQPQTAVGIDSAWGHAAVFSPTTHPTSLARKTTVVGFAVIPTSSNTSVGSNPPLLSSTERTLVVVADFSGVSSTSVAVSAGSSVTLIKNNNTSAKLLLSTVSGGDVYGSNFTVPATPFVLVVNTLFGGTGYAAYVNNVLVSSGNFSGVFKSNSLRLGGNDFGNGGSNTAVALAAMKSGRATLAEIKSLSDNPWQIFQPTTRLLYTPNQDIVLPSKGYPAKDLSKGLWTGFSPDNINTGLADKLDEPAVDTSDYIYTDYPSTTELELSETEFPGSGGYQLSYNAASSVGAVATVVMRQGMTEIARWEHVLTSTNDTYTQTLTSEQIAKIVAGPIIVNVDVN